MSASFVNCSTLRTAPCLTVELINCNCERHPLDSFNRGRFTPALTAKGNFSLLFCDGDIPADFLNCCTMIQVFLEWQEASISKQLIFSGRFTNSTKQVERGLYEQRGATLFDKFSGVDIAYKAGTAGATKENMTAIEAAYQYIVENTQTPLPDRGDGSDCATTMSGCVIVQPPNDDLILSSPMWSGTRSFENLGETVRKISKYGGFDIKSQLDDNCCCNVSFAGKRDLTDIVLSECLENVIIKEVRERCDTVSRIHMLGSGEGADQLVVTVCADNFTNSCCFNEVSIERLKETNPLALRIEGEELTDSQNDKRRVIMQTEWSCGFMPWRDVQIGDSVTLEYDGTTSVYELVGMPFEIGQGETGIELISVDAVFEEV